MEQILSRLDEICEAQKTMTDKYGPAPTQSASSNSGAGDSSHAPTNEEESSMYMEMATFLLFPSTKSERGALDQAKVTKIIYLINKRYSTYEWDMKTFVSKAMPIKSVVIVICKLLIVMLVI